MRHLCLPVHSIHRGFCSGTVDGSPQHSRTAWPQQFLWWWNRDLPVLVPKRQRGKKKRKKSQITGQVIMKWKTWIYEQSKANPHPAQTDGSKSVCDRFLKTAKWSLPVFFLFFLKKRQNRQNRTTCTTEWFPNLPPWGSFYLTQTLTLIHYFLVNLF